MRQTKRNQREIAGSHVDGPQSMVQRLGVRVLAQLTALENNQCRCRYYPLHLSNHPSGSISHLERSIHGLEGGLSRN